MKVFELFRTLKQRFFGKHFDEKRSLSLCEWFDQRSHKTWRLIETGVKNGLPFQETTLTEIILNDLLDQRFENIKVRAFSAPLESKTGADWEWVFIEGHKFIKLRIQAKRLFLPGQTYSSLSHKNSKTGVMQHDLLIQAAQKSNAVPLYCFYNYWPTQSHPVMSACLTAQRGSSFDENKASGCTIASAKSLKPLIDKGCNQLKAILPLSYPWRCLFCCNGFSTGTNDLALPEKIGRFLSGSMGIEATVHEGLDSLPWYVKRLLAQKDPSDTWWAADLPNSGLGGVAVFEDIR